MVTEAEEQALAEEIQNQTKRNTLGDSIAGLASLVADIKRRYRLNESTIVRIAEIVVASAERDSNYTPPPPPFGDVAPPEEEV